MIAGMIRKEIFEINDVVVNIDNNVEYIIDDIISCAGSKIYYISNFRHVVCGINEYDLRKNFKKVLTTI